MKKISALKPAPSRIHAPGYGFPETKKGLLPWTWAEQRLKKSHNYWFSTITPGKAKASPHTASPHTMVIWGLWTKGRFLFCTGATSRKTRNLEANANCVVCTELAHEAVVVEGIAEIADVAARRKFLPVYEKKYKYDMSTMRDDILSMKEPVYTVRPVRAFGLYEKQFQAKSTRWIFK